MASVEIINSFPLKQFIASCPSLEGLAGIDLALKSEALGSVSRRILVMDLFYRIITAG